MKKKMDLNGQLMKAYQANWLIRNRLSIGSGVPYASIHRWTAGNRKLMLESANRIADVLGLELQRKER